MHLLLNFSFLAILNLFVILLWPATGYARPQAAVASRDVLGIIMLILTIIVVVLDILFLASGVVHA